MFKTKTEYDVDLCIIGAGSAGLSMAAGAAMLDRNVLLFEGAEMGGDCLNHGCVPSKAILKAGKIAQAHRSGAGFGIKPQEPQVDWDAVKAHVADVIATIAPHDSVERFEGLGAKVITEYARFVDANTVESDTVRVRAKRFVISVGSRASAPPIPGLDSIEYATNENIFSLGTFPKHLIIFGAGPIGLEMGQTFRRLGAEVTILDIAKPLGRNEPEHAQVLVDSLTEEGITFRIPAKTKEVRKTQSGVEVELDDGTLIKGSHVLVAAGRAPAVDGLNLESAGIAYDRRGIDVDDNLRTSNKKVYAAGDVAKGKGGLTHIAGFHAGQLFKNFFLLPQGISKGFSTAKTNRMPAAVYTEPELASIGLTEAQARETYGDAVKVATFDFDGNDRGIAERSTKGGVKIIVGKKGVILGGSIVGDSAGEMIHLLSVAMTGKMKASGLAQIISPYPTRSEAVKRACSSLFTDDLFGPKSKVRKTAAFWAKFH